MACVCRSTPMDDSDIDVRVGHNGCKLQGRGEHRATGVRCLMPHMFTLI